MSEFMSEQGRKADLSVAAVPKKRPLNMLRAAEAARKCGFSIPTLWRKSKLEVDFPKPVKVSENCTAWVDEELDAWLRERVAQSRR